MARHEVIVHVFQKLKHANNQKTTQKMHKKTNHLIAAGTPDGQVLVDEMASQFDFRGKRFVALQTGKGAVLSDGVQLGSQLRGERDAAPVAKGHGQADDFVCEPQDWHVGGALAQSAAAACARGGRRGNLGEGRRRADAVRAQARAARLLVQVAVIFDQRGGFP